MKANRRDEEGNPFAKVITHHFVGHEHLVKAAIWYVADTALATQAEYDEIVAGMKRKHVEKALHLALMTYGTAWAEGDPADFVVGLYHHEDVVDVRDMVEPVVAALYPEFQGQGA